MKYNLCKFKYLRLAILTIFSFIVSCSIFDAEETISGITPVGSIRDSFDVFDLNHVDMTTTSDNELYLLERNNGVFKADLQTKVWRHILKTGCCNDKIFSIGENDLFVYEKYAVSILHSADKGNTWEKISCPSAMLMRSDEEKRIWLVDRENDLYISEDKGKTWDKGHFNRMVHDILYDKETHSLWITSGNEIYKSADYGRSFSQIPTPVTSKYDTESDKLTLGSDKNYYYVHQRGFVYKTDKEHIEWKEVDGEKDGNPFSDDINDGETVSCEGDNCLWILTDNGILSKVCSDEVTKYKMRAELPIQLDCQNRDTIHNNIIVYYNGIYYYVRNKHIYCKERAEDILLEKTEKWYRYLDLDSKVCYLWKDKDGVYMCDENFKKYQINQEIDSIKSYKSEFDDFREKKIEKIIIIQGLIACESSFSSLTYLPSKDGFVKTKENQTGDHMFENMPQNISKASVQKLQQCVYDVMCGVEDTSYIKLTKNDLNNYKNKLDKDIELFEDENIDILDRYFYLDYYWNRRHSIGKKELRFLSASLDTLNITQQKQSIIFSKTYKIDKIDIEGYYDFCVVFLCFDDGSSLALRSNVSIEPVFLRCPWTAFYNGEPYSLKSVGVGKSIDEMTQGKLLSDCNTKEHALKTIFRYLLE